MNTGVVSMRYARALLAYAKGQKVEDRVYEEVKTLAANYVNVPDLRRAIENPVLDAKRKCELLREASGGKEVSEELMRFFALVLDERRENSCNSCCGRILIYIVKIKISSLENLLPLSLPNAWKSIWWT